MHVVILGNGVAGVSAALRLRELQPAWRITLVSGESRHHYSRPALMYIFLGHINYRDTKPFEDEFWLEKRIDLAHAWVTRVDLERRLLLLDGGESIAWDKLLLATGSRPNRFGWPGQDLAGVQGLYGLQDLARLHENIRHASHAVIVGGGLIGIELAEMLHEFGVGITFLVREPSYWSNVLPAAESAMVNREIERHGMELRLETELQEVLDDGTGRCGAAVTIRGERIECQFVGLTAGVSPNIDVIRDTPIAVGRGVRVDGTLRTTIPGIWAAGDCAEIVTPESAGSGTVQQVWYTGKMQGEVAGENIARSEGPEPAVEYDAGIWFNSAKFLDLEYQTYGRVNQGVPGERSFYWESSDAAQAVRIVHVDGAVIGVNVMGTRWRHETCERWIRERRPVEEVLSCFEEAHFDPEFFRRRGPEMRCAFMEQAR